MMKLKTTVAVLILAMCYASSILAQETIEKDQYSVILGCGISDSTTLCSPFCAFGAYTVIERLEAIKPIKTDMETGRCTFELSHDNQQSIDSLLTHFEQKGLTPFKIEITRSTGTTEKWPSDK